MSSVGEILKNTREAKGITIEQVAEATSIRVLYLEAIENEQFNLIPGEVYLKGFIRNYASYIGLNGPAMVEKYKEQAEAEQKDEHSVQIDKRDVHQKIQEQTVEGNVKSNKSGGSSSNALIGKFLTKRNIGFLAIFLAVIAVGNFLSSFFASDKENPPAKSLPAAVERVKTELNDKEQNASVTKDQSGAYVVKNASKIETKVVFDGDCWTEAYADGKEVFVGMMAAGKTVNWQAEKELQIKMGNVRAAKIECNGQLIPYETDENGVAIRTFKR